MKILLARHRPRVRLPSDPLAARPNTFPKSPSCSDRGVCLGLERETYPRVRQEGPMRRAGRLLSASLSSRAAHRRIAAELMATVIGERSTMDGMIAEHSDLLSTTLTGIAWFVPGVKPRH